jgi:ACS family D-galactonate transporter-like MFS transporter
LSQAVEAAPPSEAPKSKVADALVLMVCQSSQALVLGGVALFLPLIRHDLHLSFAQAGSLDAASSLVYAFMQIPAGLMADKFGPRRLFITGLIGVDVLALSFSLQRGFDGLIANQVLTGIFRAMMFAPGLLLMTRLFPPQRRATAMGLYLAGGVSSSFMLNLFGPVLVGPLGWRGNFQLFSALGLIALTTYVVRSRGSAAAAPPLHPVPLRESRRLLRERGLWLVAAIQYTRLAVVFGINVWLPTYVVVQRHYSLQVAGLLVALGAVITAPSNLIGGFVADRLGRPILVIGGSLVILAANLVLLSQSHSLATLIIAVVINASFSQLYFGPIFSVPIELFGLRNAGFISGFGNGFANLGAFTFIYALGAIRDATGSFSAGFDAIAVACVFGALCAVALGRERSRKLA